jgi:hypothetical protein
LNFVTGVTSAIQTQIDAKAALASPAFTGQASFADGTAAAPSIAHTGDLNAGLFFPAADTVAVSTAGVERMRIDSAGSVGIGVSNPEDYRDFGPAPALVFGNTTGSSQATIVSGTASEGNLTFADGTTGNDSYRGLIRYNHSSDYMAFFTAATERMRIDSSGNLLVGKTASGGTTLTGLEVDSTGTTMTTTINSAGTSNAYHFYNTNATNNGYRFYVQANGGIVNFSANNVNLSDERVKTDIAPLGSYWDKIKALEVVTYKYRDQSHEDNNIGVIAQQVESVAPEFISNEGFGETPANGVPLKSVYEADLHYATLKALQEAMARIETLEARITALEA